jgi:hypothetical protein
MSDETDDFLMVDTTIRQNNPFPEYKEYDVSDFDPDDEDGNDDYFHAEE